MPGHSCATRFRARRCSCCPMCWVAPTGESPRCGSDSSRSTVSSIDVSGPRHHRATEGASRSRPPNRARAATRRFSGIALTRAPRSPDSPEHPRTGPRCVARRRHEQRPRTRHASRPPQSGFWARMTSVSPGQSQKVPSGDRNLSSSRTSSAKSSTRSPKRCGAEEDMDR
jgi:hypothetical protein